MELYTHGQMLDEIVGKKGTARRDRYDTAVKLGVTAQRLGDVVREERQRQNLTRKQLGEKAGVNENVVSKVENGHSASYFSVDGLLRALGIRATYDMGRLGRVALW